MLTRNIWDQSVKSTLGLAIATLVCVLAFAASIARADDSTGKELQLTNPLDGATIREIVPVQISVASLPADFGGYVSIAIDDVFRLATAIPAWGPTRFGTGIRKRPLRRLEATHPSSPRTVTTRFQSGYSTTTTIFTELQLQRSILPITFRHKISRME